MAGNTRKPTVPIVHGSGLPGFLRRKKLPQLFFLIGEENYYKERAFEAVIAAVRAGGVEPEVLRLPLADLGPGELAQECATQSLFGGARVVFVEGTEDLAEEDLAAVTPETIAPNVFALVSLGKKAKPGDVRGPAGKTLIVNCPSLYPEKMPAWLQGQVKSRTGKNIPAKAATMVVQLAGQNLSTLESQLEKLDLYTGTRKNIREEDVRAIIGLEREFASYEIVDAVSEKKPSLALERMREGLSRGMQPTTIITYVGSRLRDLLRAKRICASRGQKALAAELGVHPYVATMIAKQAEDLEEKEIEDKLWLVLKTQSLLRSGGGPDEVLAEALIVRLCAE